LRSIIVFRVVFTQNFGGGALSPSAHHPPPVGGVRIFPVAPAPAPAKPQVKVLFLDFSIVVEKVKKTKFYFRVLCVFAFFYSFYLILFLKNFCHF
jgi:hypothetical protein